MALPRRTTGSLRPTFVPVRGVPLTVKQVYAFTLNVWFPITLNLPLRASVTLWEATAPVKLPAMLCLGKGYLLSVRNQKLQGWYFNDDSIGASASTSKSPTYSTHATSGVKAKVQ